MAVSDGEVVERRGMTRGLVRWLVKRYYPYVEITGADRIPQTGPVLLCGNHGNSLIDPVLIGVAARRPVRFMAKAPLFDNPLLGPSMRALGMIPAYRGMDDRRQVRRNVESLDVGAKQLAEGRAMGIFPEGKSTDQSHLETVRSGAARMAVKAVEQGAERLQVVPIGLTYQRKDKFRTAVWIQVGEPIDVAAWIADHDGDSRKAMRALTQELETRLKQIVVHLEEPQWEPWLEDMEHLVQPPQAPKKSPTAPLHQRKRIADAMNHFAAADQSRATAVARQIEDYRNQVHTAGLTVDSPVMRKHGFKVALLLVWNFLCLLVLFIPAVLGTLHHLVPFVVVRGIAARLDQAGRMTVTTNRMAVGVPIYLLWYALVAWWMFGYYAPWFAWAWLIAAPFAGLLAIYYWRRARNTARLLWHQLRMATQRKQLKQLREQQAKLCRQLGEMSDEYARLCPVPPPEPDPTRWERFFRLAFKVLFLLVLLTAAWISKYWIFDRPLHGVGLDLASLSAAQLETNLAADEKTILQLIDGLDRLEQEAITINDEFEQGHRSFTVQGDNDDVRELLRRFIAYREALLRIVWKYQRYAELEQDQLRLRTFLLDFTAASLLFESSAKFVDLFHNSPQAIAKLNEDEPIWGIPPDVYDITRRNLASPENLRMFDAARQFYHQDLVQESFKTHGLSAAEPYDRFHSAILRAETTIRNVDNSLPERIVEVAAKDLGKLFHRVQYDTQSTVSTWIGDFKIRQPRSGESLIDEEQLARLSKLLQPGDILLERRNWYLSNAFLPGYWPHGAVYVGTAEDLAERGLDQNDYVREHWDAFTRPDHGGHAKVIIEAVSEGVIFSSLEHSIGGADSVAVLRPRVSEEEKNEAIARAFSFAGRPYDFEFDFQTTNMLVCTEVVFRTYGGNSGVIQFPLVEIMGRQTMPAIKLVEKFDDEYGSEEAQFEFVAFIDGDELTGTSQFITDVDAFRQTRHRPASSFLQGSNQYALRSIGPLGWVLASLTVLAGVWLVGAMAVRRIRAHASAETTREAF